MISFCIARNVGSSATLGIRKYDTVLRGGGTINLSVRELISNELQIRVEVPALELSAGGQVSKDPEVLLGPNSVGTLAAVRAFPRACAAYILV